MNETARSPRVLHLVPALFDGHDGVIGGAERYALELARHMADVVPTRLVTFGNRERVERIGALDVRVIGEPWLVRGQRANPVSPRVVAEVRRADVVHCHQQHVLSSSVAAVTARLTGRRVFCSDLGGGGWDISAYVSTDRWYHGHLHLSEYSRQIAGHAGALCAHVVLGGVDTKRFSPGSQSVRDGTVLFVGRLLPHKGINDLIDALDEDMRAEIIGPAPDVRYLRDLESRGCGKQVTFRLECDDTALIEAYRRAACVVLPSVYRDMYGGATRIPELLGQTLLEGMACGAATLCTNVASLPEIVEDQRTGLIVPPGNPAALRAALRWFRSHTSEATAMGRRGRRRVLEHFTWPSVVRRCLDVYGGVQTTH